MKFLSIFPKCFLSNFLTVFPYRLTWLTLSCIVGCPHQLGQYILSEFCKVLHLVFPQRLCSISFASIQYFSCIYSVFLMPSTDLSYFVLPCPVSSSVGWLSQHRLCPASIHTLIHSTHHWAKSKALFILLKASTKYFPKFKQSIALAYIHS